MPLTTRDILNTIYGISGTIRENPLVNQVGITVVRILPANPNRLSFVLVNLSANDLYIKPFENVSATSGIYITPSGGSAIFQWDKDLILPTLEWYAIAGGAASDIYLLEVISQ